MNTRKILLLVGLVLAGTVQAQATGEYHPFLTDRFQINAGMFFPTQDYNLSADGTVPGEDIDFDQTLGLDNKQATAGVTTRWNMSDKWSLWGQWWATDVSDEHTLDQDVTWNGVVFEAGSTVEAGVDNNIIRLFLGRELWSGPQYELGVGIGVHWMKLSAFIEGDVTTSTNSTGHRREETSVSAPLPNIGLWYYYSPSSKWLLSARVDWLSASIGDYSGTLWNMSGGVNYQFTEHLGLGLYYQVFELNVDVENDDWHGTADINNHGPFIALTANW